MTHFLERSSLYFGLAVAWIAMLGSLYFSEVAGYLPCSLCWYQRILMYPLAGIIAVGLLRRDRGVPYYMLPFSVLGIATATYHYLLQKTNIFDSGAVCQAGVPCTTMWINWAGFITIPFLALTAFVMITGAALIALQAPEEEREDAIATPWLPVAGAIAIAFVLVGMAGIINRPATSATQIPDLTVVEAPAAKAMSANLSGAELYAEACAVCHGQNLEGVAGLGNALADNAFIAANSDEAVLAMIRAGRAANDPNNSMGMTMPMSGGRPDLTDAEMTAIVQYLRSAQGGE